MSYDQPRVREVRQGEDRFLASDVFDSARRTLGPRNGTGIVRLAANCVLRPRAVPAAELQAALLHEAADAAAAARA